MTHRSRSTPAGFRRQLAGRAADGNPLAATYWLRMNRATDRAAEAQAIQAELAQVMRQYRHVSRVILGSLPRNVRDNLGL
jgi:hypothetical protein